LPGASGKEIKVDITLKEKIVFPVKEKRILKAYPEYTDLPNKTLVRSYALEEIAAEKIIALLDFARNEPRDLYDLWYLATNQYIHIDELIDAVTKKWQFRNKKLNDVKKEFLRKQSRLNKLWGTRFSSQMANLPEFDRVYREVQKELRKAGFLKPK
jgi:predicted nucleotidyltransferase component of viral defense system